MSNAAAEVLDRDKLLTATEKIQTLLRRLPVGRAEVTEAHEAERNSHNLNVYSGGMYVGVIDIVTRKNPLDWFEDCGTVVVELDRLKRLKRHFFRKAGGCWAKDVCLAWMTSDDAVMLMNIREIIAHWDELQPVPKDGRFLPVDRMIVI